MRIVIDARSLMSSTGRYYERILHEILKIDEENDYHVLLRKDGYEYCVVNIKAANFTPYLVDVRYFTIAEQFLLPKIIRRLSPDLIHYTFQQMPLKSNHPYILTVFDFTQLKFFSPKPGSNALFWKLKQLLLGVGISRSIKNADHIITTSTFVKDQIINDYSFPRNKASTIYGGFDPVHHADAKVGALKDKEYLLYVGSAFRHKNLERLIDAYASLISKKPSLYLVFAGKIDLFHEKLIERAKSKGLKKFLHLGFVTDEQLTWLYRHASIYVMPSLSEGLGMPGLESLANGCVLVSSNATCSPEIYKNAAIFFDPLNVDDIAEKILIGLENEEQRVKVLANSKMLLKNYDWGKAAKETLATYENVLKG